MLLEVDHGWALQMPHGIGNPHDRVWLMPGGVVDSSDPYIAHAIKGQEHKFKQAGANAKASEVPPVLVNDRAQWMTKAVAVPKTEIKKTEALKTAAATGSTSNIELPTIGKPAKPASGVLKRKDDATRNTGGCFTVTESSTPYASDDLSVSGYTHAIIYAATNTGASETITGEH